MKLSSMKQKGLPSDAREGRCCPELSTRCSSRLWIGELTAMYPWGVGNVVK